MEKIILRNKPLVEAIFELRWELNEIQPGVRTDPYYKILIGRIHEKIDKEYPYYEQLPTSTIPDEIASYIVQHRFRKDKDKWPLIQIGPGVITLNDTEGYNWEDFEKRIIELLEAFFEVYPEVEKSLKISSLLLRYIDAIEFDFENEDIFSFLKEKMKIDISISKEIFEKTNVYNRPIDIDFRFSFPSTNPQGAIHMRVLRGRIRNSDALLWETMVNIGGKNAPQEKDGILQWVRDAHKLTHNWFFKIIQGDLQRRFE